MHASIHYTLSYIKGQDMPKVVVKFTKEYKTKKECEFFIECCEKNDDTSVEYLELEIIE